MTRKNVVAAARGEHPFDLFIKDAQLVNVLTAELSRVDIGVVGNRIAAVAPGGTLSPSGTVNEGNGRDAAPGFIDGQGQKETSMCTPAEWAGGQKPQGHAPWYTH